MYRGWLTLNLEEWNPGPVREEISGYSLSLTAELPEWEGVIKITCSICGHRLSPKIVPVDNKAGSEGRNIIQSCMRELEGRERTKDVLMVSDHLKKTRVIILTSEVFLPDCDCDYRFHQLVQRPGFIDYIGGKGYYGDVDCYLEL